VSEPGPRGNPGRERLGWGAVACLRGGRRARRAAGAHFAGGLPQLFSWHLRARALAPATAIPGGIYAVFQLLRSRPLRRMPTMWGWMSKRPVPEKSRTGGSGPCKPSAATPTSSSGERTLTTGAPRPLEGPHQRLRTEISPLDLQDLHRLILGQQTAFGKLVGCFPVRRRAL
jgi:hypothetical protein